MCDPSALTHEMYDCSLPTEMPIRASFQRRESPELRHPTDSEPGRRSLLQRLRETPAIDPHCSSAKHLSNGWSNRDESGNMTLSIPTEASRKDDRHGVPTLGTGRTSIANSLHRQSDGNRCAIFVSTDISREISDSSGQLTEPSRVETVISSSPKHKSLDLNRPLQTSPQRNSVILNQPLLSMPNSSSAHTSPIKTSSSRRFSATDSGIGEYGSPDTLNNMICGEYDMSWESHSPHEASLMSSSLKASSDGQVRPDEPDNHPFWTGFHPMPADSPDSNFVSPISPTSGLSSPWSNMFSPSPIAEFVSPQPNFVFPVTVTHKNLDLGTAEHHENVAGGWISLSPPPPGPKPNEPEHTRSAFTTFEPRLPIMTQVDHPNIWSSNLSPPVSSSASSAKDIHMDSSFTNGSTGTLKAEIPVAPFAPAHIDAGDHGLHELPSPFSLPYSSQRSPSVASPSRRQMNVWPLPNSMSDSSSLDEEGEKEIPRPQRSRATPRSLTPSWVLSQSQSQEEGESSGEVLSFESDFNSAHQYRSSLPNALHSPSAIKTLPRCFDHGSLLVTGSNSKQTQVGVLQVLVSLVHLEWMQRLESSPELRLRCSALSARVLFERGIWTLRECFCGRLAQTFEDVFAFIHLAFAITFFLHCQHNLFCLDGFYDEALLWQHALSDKEDKILFLKAMERWSWVPKLPPTSLLNDSHHVCFGSVPLRETFHQTGLLDVLRNTEILKACVGFLEGKSIFIPFKTYNHYTNWLLGFEVADISERNAQSAEALASFAQSRIDEIEHMTKHITHPLQEEPCIEAFRRIVIDTEFLIAKGWLQNPREVEVTLKTSARVSSKSSSSSANHLTNRIQWNSESSEVLETFHDTVTNQCNEAMPSSCSDWYSTGRNNHYILDLDRVLETSKELDLWPYVRGFEVTSPNQPAVDSPAPWSSVSNGAETPESSPTSVMSWTSTGSSKRPEDSTRTTSPTTMSPASTSPTSVAPNSPTTSVASCRACSLSFTGSPQDAKSNLQRHLRTSPRHNTNAGLKCPLPECRMRPRMRSDNLRQHLQRAHKMSSASERQVIIDESRSSARRVDRNGIARPRSRLE